MNIDKTVAAYVKIRDKIAALRKERDAEIEELQDMLDTLEQSLLEHAKAEGVTGFKTDYGTASRVVKERFWPSDWDAMRNFMAEHDEWDLLENRLSQRNIKSFIEAHPDIAPPVNIDRVFKINVRRASPAKKTTEE